MGNDRLNLDLQFAATKATALLRSDAGLRRGPAVQCGVSRCAHRSPLLSRGMRQPESGAIVAALSSSARSYSAVGRGGTIALGLRGPADAIGKAIARRMPPASSCMTTAQPGRTSSPPRPARRLLAWHCDDAGRGSRTIAFGLRPRSPFAGPEQAPAPPVAREQRRRLCQRRG